jgi:hypothetical protein
MMIRTSAILSVALLSGLSLRAQTTPGNGDAAAWNKLEFLLGKWTGIAGEKDTPLGAGKVASPFNQS